MAVSYVGAVLLEEDRDMLLERAGHRENPAMTGWEEKGHHMTLTMGAAKGEFVDWLNREVELRVIAFGVLFMENGAGVAAVKVETAAPSKNSVKHITLAVDVARGAKAKQSNEIQEWTPLPEPFVVRALVREVEFAPAK